MNIEEITRKIKSCFKCQLRSKEVEPLPGAGSDKSNIMFIGIAPAPISAKMGRHWQGHSRKCFENLLRFLGLNRDSVYLTDIVKCPLPPGRPPLPEEIEACRDYLKQEIRIIRPKVIVTLGNPALQWFFPYKSISSFRKFGLPKITYEQREIIFCPLYHPIYIQRYGGGLENFKLELEKLRQILKTIGLITT